LAVVVLEAEAPEATGKNGRGRKGRRRKGRGRKGGMEEGGWKMKVPKLKKKEKIRGCLMGGSLFYSPPW
jgi:hypothetical protein